MVAANNRVFESISPVSVLALSSRFDGPQQRSANHYIADVSVLALSSRFDGRRAQPTTQGVELGFQYSLCRVVLMVFLPSAVHCLGYTFQYSLCRVVLMVLYLVTLPLPSNAVSVLALSSRFDGRFWRFPKRLQDLCFSTRSVESF